VPVRLAFFAKNPVSQMELSPGTGLIRPVGGRDMLVERGIKVMSVEAVGDAYAIASNYLRRTGAIADSFATNEALLQIIVELFQRGDFNKIRLANRAIAKFEASHPI
jgi:hypothetical protein